MDSTLTSTRPGEGTLVLTVPAAPAGSYAGPSWTGMILLYGITAALVFNREFFPAN